VNQRIVKMMTILILILSFAFQTSSAANVSPIIQVKSPASADQARAHIKKEIFGVGDDTKYTKFIQISNFCKDNPTFLYCKKWASDYKIRVFDVGMQKGITSRVFEISPQIHRRNVFYLRGHYPTESDSSPLFFQNIDSLLKKNNKVFLFSMPFNFPNLPETAIEHSFFGKLIIGPSHNEFSFIEDEVLGSPLKYFVQPQIVILNKLITKNAKVGVIGLSGGGWTATLLASIDPRIQLTYSVAGTYPFDVKSEAEKDLGDWEQWLPGISREFDYRDLYILGTFRDRSVVNVYNSADPCCYGVRPGSLRWVKGVSYQARKLGGQFRAMVEESSIHDIGPIALTSFLEDLENLG
jgi:hypothetical protein